jgi:hypothetical protein
MNRYPAIFHGLQELLADRPNSSLKLLSFGCSDGSEVRTLRQYYSGATIHGVDVDKNMITQNTASNRDPLVSYFSNTTFLQPESYDAVLAMGVLCRQHHVTDRLPYKKFVESTELIDKLIRPGGFMVVYNSDFSFDEYPYSFRYKNMAEDCKGGVGMPERLLSADQRGSEGMFDDRSIVRGNCAPWTGKYCIESGWRWKFTYLGENVQPAGSGYVSFGCKHPGVFFKKLSAIPDLTGEMDGYGSSMGAAGTAPTSSANNMPSNSYGTNNLPTSGYGNNNLPSGGWDNQWQGQGGWGTPAQAMYYGNGA